MWKTWTHKGKLQKHIVERRIQKKKGPVEGHTDKEVPINRINGAEAEAEAHISEAHSGNSAAKRTDATISTMKNTGSFNAEVVKEIINSQVEVNVSENGKVEWILDSGCRYHIIKNKSYFTNYVCMRKGVRQGCPLSPLLFALVIADVEEEMKKGQGGIWIGKNRIWTLANADDLVRLAKNEERA